MGRITAETLHCRITAESVLNHCRITAESLLKHCTAESLPNHCRITAESLPNHCRITAESLPNHCHRPGGYSPQLSNGRLAHRRPGGTLPNYPMGDSPMG